MLHLLVCKHLFRASPVWQAQEYCFRNNGRKHANRILTRIGLWWSVCRHYWMEVGFYMTAISDAILIPLAVYGLPKPRSKTQITWNRLILDIGWVGAIIASASLAMLSYVLASLTTSAAAIGHPANIALLVIGVALIPAFVLWVGRQERLGRPAIIPNSLWSNPAFTFICLSTFLAWGAFNAFQFGMTLFFQDVRL